jgi:prepilin-type N-terminal cleavage/methylation domain-containing protein
MQKKHFGFTLIELLIVVAIIAILAAIAIPNFLAAQTRAKVSRAKGEIKTLATALESYYVDNTSYPSDQDTIAQGPWYVPDAITTPISYIGKSQGRIDDIFRVNTYGPQATWQLRYRRYRYINFDEDCTGFWPVNYTGLVAGADDFRRGRWNYGKWRLSSAGPDGVAGPTTDIFSGGTYKGVTLNPQYTYLPNDLLYDPTNGTMSWGDIIRSQKEADHRMQYESLTGMGME